MKLVAFVISLFGSGNQPAKPATVARPAAVRHVRVAQAVTANDLVDKVQKFYQSTAQLTAKFRQTTMNATFGLPQQSDGKVYLKKPGKMRWDYYSKRSATTVTKSQISDGKTIWVVDKNGKWYFKQDLTKSALPVAVTFLTGTGNLKNEFNAAIDKSGLYNKATPDDHVLKLTPKKPSVQIKALYLVVDPTNFRVKKSIVINAAGDTNQFAFHEPDFARAVNDSWFKFDPKAMKGFREIKEQDAAKK
ncbi:MAG TPA: outer membrane lipoprotein carrier protein LolA [Kofleriaceae bacterium]|nr:outer membrane lipoprotein carrier protein LolA [Kofleriaceae bacterium]